MLSYITLALQLLDVSQFEISNSHLIASNFRHKTYSMSSGQSDQSKNMHEPRHEQISRPEF